MSYSAGIHLKYADPNSPDYAISTTIMIIALSAMFISVVAMQVGGTGDKSYG